MYSGPAGPPVAFPPTLFFVIALALALGLHDYHPLALVSALFEPWRVPAGAGLTVAGIALFVWGVLTMTRARTGVMFERPAVALILRGPYRWSRNPMYVAFVVGYVGLAALFNSLWPLLILPAPLVLVGSLVIAREEQYLRTKFGAAYDAYCRSVRRWL